MVCSAMPYGLLPRAAWTALPPQPLRLPVPQIEDTLVRDRWGPALASRLRALATHANGECPADPAAAAAADSAAAAPEARPTQPT